MKKIATGLVSFLVPALAFAQQLQNVETFFRSIERIINLLLPMVVALALLGFFWGLATFIFSAGNEDAKERGRRIMIWGVVALFVMVAVWGLVQFIGNALGISIGQDLNSVPGVNP